MLPVDFVFGVDVFLYRPVEQAGFCVAPASVSVKSLENALLDGDYKVGSSVIHFGLASVRLFQSRIFSARCRETFSRSALLLRRWCRFP